MFSRKKKNVTAIGQLVDMNMKDFKKYLAENSINIGMMNNLIFSLNGAYANLRQRKDALMDMYGNPKVSNSSKNKIEKSIKGIYVELTKIEEKVVYLQEQTKKLLDLDAGKEEQGEIDTKKE